MCPNPEILAALVEGGLDRPEREALLDHAASCDDCRHALLLLTPKYGRHAVRPRSWIPWAAAAASFVVSVLGFLLLRRGDPAEPPVVREEVTRPPEPPAPEAAPPPPVPKPEKPIWPEKPAPKPPVVPTPVPPAPEPTPEPPAPKPAPPEEPPAPKPPPPPPPVSATVAIVAVLDRVEGEVFVVRASDRVAVKAGQSLRPGDGLECAGANTVAQLSFPDKTRVEAAGDTMIREIADAKGKRIRLEKGAVSAEVARQPEGLPLLFITPHGEAKVIGTTLRLHVDTDPKKGTRLEVAEGKVELRNTAGRAIIVEAGRQAVAAAGVPMALRPVPKEEVLVSFDLEDGKLPAAVDTGTVERGPTGRLCLAGVNAQGTCRVFIGPPAGFFHFEGDEVLSFDYWVDGGADQVNLNIWNRTQKVQHEAVVPKLVYGRWTRATFPLADMGAPGVRLKEGDLVANLYVQGTGAPPQRRFYIDNVQFTRPWSIKLR